GVVRQRPAARPAPLEHATRDRERRLAMGLRRDLRGRRVDERLRDALPHLRGGLARERDRDDLLGLVDVREQRQIASYQELRFPRARGRLDDERFRRIERPLADVLVAHAGAPPSPRSEAAASASCSYTRVNGAKAPAAAAASATKMRTSPAAYSSTSRSRAARHASTRSEIGARRAGRPGKASGVHTPA